jgi:hypothetical protein
MAAEANGAVYDIASMRASYLVCAVNHVVHVYSVGSGLRREASYDGLIVALKVRCRGSLIIIGDMMRSITLLKFNPWQPALVEIAHDYNANWTCALEAFTDGSFLIAEASGNLVALDRCCSGSDIDYCLESRARMHLGDVVACFARGSLTTRNDWYLVPWVACYPLTILHNLYYSVSVAHLLIPLLLLVNLNIALSGLFAMMSILHQWLASLMLTSLSSISSYLSAYSVILLIN